MTLNNIIESYVESNQYLQYTIPMFYIHLIQNINNKEIHKIKYLMHSSVIFEAPHHRKYARRHEFDHARNFCPRTTRDHEIGCLNCNESTRQTSHDPLYTNSFKTSWVKNKHSAYKPQHIQPGISYPKQP